MSDLLKKVKQITPSDRVHRIRALNNGATVSSNGKIIQYESHLFGAVLIGNVRVRHIKKIFERAFETTWSTVLIWIGIAVWLFAVGYTITWIFLKPY